MGQEDASSTSGGVVEAMDALRETVKLGVERIRYRSKATGNRALYIQFFHVPTGEDHPTTCHDDGAPFSRLHSETLIPRLRSETLIPESSFRGLHSRAFIAILGTPCRALPCALLDKMHTLSSVISRFTVDSLPIHCESFPIEQALPLRVYLS